MNHEKLNYSLNIDEWNVVIRKREGRHYTNLSSTKHWQSADLHEVPFNQTETVLNLQHIVHHKSIKLE